MINYIISMCLVKNKCVNLRNFGTDDVIPLNFHSLNAKFGHPLIN